MESIHGMPPAAAPAPTSSPAKEDEDSVAGAGGRLSSMQELVAAKLSSRQITSKHSTLSHLLGRGRKEPEKDDNSANPAKEAGPGPAAVPAPDPYAQWLSGSSGDFAAVEGKRAKEPAPGPDAVSAPDPYAQWLSGSSGDFAALEGKRSPRKLINARRLTGSGSGSGEFGVGDGGAPAQRKSPRHHAVLRRALSSRDSASSSATSRDGNAMAAVRAPPPPLSNTAVVPSWLQTPPAGATRPPLAPVQRSPEDAAALLLQRVGRCFFGRALLARLFRLRRLRQRRTTAAQQGTGPGAANPTAVASTRRVRLLV
jgi:hypothetical protein